MTDLATLRAGCQRGEMPEQPAVVTALSKLRHDVSSERLKRALLAVRRGKYDPPVYILDAIAALQEALWPGSRISIGAGTGPTTNGVWMDFVFVYAPVNGIVGMGERCPTLATAWLDAILAGLETNDG